MIYWLVEFKDGTHGYQVMDENRTTIALCDVDGNRLTGNMEYTTISTDQTGPFPTLNA